MGTCVGKLPDKVLHPAGKVGDHLFIEWFINIGVHDQFGHIAVEAGAVEGALSPRGNQSAISQQVDGPPDLAGVEGSHRRLVGEKLIEIAAVLDEVFCYSFNDFMGAAL